MSFVKNNFKKVMESFDLFLELQPWIYLVIDLSPKKNKNNSKRCNFVLFLNK